MSAVHAPDADARIPGPAHDQRLLRQRPGRTVRQRRDKVGVSHLRVTLRRRFYSHNLYVISNDCRIIPASACRAPLPTSVRRSEKEPSWSSAQSLIVQSLEPVSTPSSQTQTARTCYNHMHGRCNETPLHMRHALGTGGTRSITYVLCVPAKLGSQTVRAKLLHDSNRTYDKKN